MPWTDTDIASARGCRSPGRLPAGTPSAHHEAGARQQHPWSAISDAMSRSRSIRLKPVATRATPPLQVFRRRRAHAAGRHQAKEESRARETAVVEESSARRIDRMSPARGRSEVRAQRCVRDADGRESQPPRGAESGEQQALHEDLPDDLQTRGPEREPHGDFAPAGGRAGQQHVRDVGAGDEEDESDTGHEHEYGGAGIAHDSFLEWNDGDIPVRTGELGLEACGDRIELGLRLRHADAGCQSRKTRRLLESREEGSRRGEGAPTLRQTAQKGRR